MARPAWPAAPRDTAPFTGVRPAAQPARPVACVVVDAEEDFDWDRPVRGTPHATLCMRHVDELGRRLAAHAIRPAYLLTYPVLQDAPVVAMLRRLLERDECDLGVQLHPWVTPPFNPDDPEPSYAGALPPAAEEAKLLALMAKFRACFGTEPRLFRAGRYGLSGATPGLLERHGFAVDTSLAPRSDFSGQGGPDFSAWDCAPFWFGQRRELLEMPLGRSVIGWSGTWAPALYAAGVRGRPLVPAVLGRLRCAERVTLSPEGNDVAAMVRLLRHRLGCGQTVFALSFHSSSLRPGRNPYVRTPADLAVFHARMDRVLEIMASRLGFGFSRLPALPTLLTPAPLTRGAPAPDAARPAGDGR